MKKFILNLLTVFAWIYQIFCVIGIIMWIVMGGVMLFGIRNPDFRAGFEEGMGIKGVSVDSYIGAIVVGWLSLIMMSVAAFLICRYARLIVKNIKQEVYFDQANLHELKQLLIRSIVYTVLSIISWAIILPMDSTPFYPNAYIADLVFIAIVYVVYLIFKHGLALRDDTNKII